MLTLWSDIPGMVHWTSQWDEFLASTGNEPGVHAGDVVVDLVAPVNGKDKIRCASNDLTAAVSGGQFVGLAVVTPEGRRLFLPWGNVAGIGDAEAGAASARPRSRPGKE